MSSLIFYTDESQALIATDSLAVDAHGNPAFFCSKANHIPHLKMIIAGTGAGGFSNEWALQASTRMVVKGIHNLDYHTPEGLRALWKEYKEKYSLPESFTTTVYQFGISEETKGVVGFAYRSTNNFMSEEVGYGTGVKPECDILEGNLIELLPVMMKQQRLIQNSAPKNERVYIGGEIIAFHLTANGCNTFKVSEFDDFSEHVASIFENYESNKS
ncbi:hypothetical protein [Zobellella denitrificans]